MTMIDDLKYIISKVEESMDDYLAENKSVDSHVMYLQGKLDGYKYVLKILEAGANA